MGECWLHTFLKCDVFVVSTGCFMQSKVSFLHINWYVHFKYTCITLPSPITNGHRLHSSTWKYSRECYYYYSFFASFLLPAQIVSSRIILSVPCSLKLCTVFFFLFLFCLFHIDRVLLLNPVAFLAHCTPRAPDEWYALLHDAFHLNVMANERRKKSKRKTKTNTNTKLCVAERVSAYYSTSTSSSGCCVDAPAYTTNQTHTH